MKVGGLVGKDGSAGLGVEQEGSSVKVTEVYYVMYDIVTSVVRCDYAILIKMCLQHSAISKQGVFSLPRFCFVPLSWEVRGENMVGVPKPARWLGLQLRGGIACPSPNPQQHREEIILNLKILLSSHSPCAITHFKSEVTN